MRRQMPSRRRPRRRLHPRRWPRRQPAHPRRRLARTPTADRCRERFRLTCSRVVPSISWWWRSSRDASTGFLMRRLRGWRITAKAGQAPW